MENIIQRPEDIQEIQKRKIRDFLAKTAPLTELLNEHLKRMPVRYLYADGQMQRIESEMEKEIKRQIEDIRLETIKESGNLIIF